jgi:hypothetical protein
MDRLVQQDNIKLCPVVGNISDRNAADVSHSVWQTNDVLVHGVFGWHHRFNNNGELLEYDPHSR